MSSPSQQLTAELILEAKATLGEGALWHPEQNKLYWVDIEGKALHIFDPATNKDQQFDVGSRIGTVVPAKGNFALVALQNGIHKIDTTTGKLTMITDPIEEDDIRFNDGKCDPAGRFWVGTMALDTRKGAAVLYCLGADGSIKQVLDNLTIANGIVWTSDKRTMYFTDTRTQQVQAFDYDNDSGEISNSRTIITIPEAEGSPDGMTLDAEGKLWIALFRGGCIARYDPETGEQLQKVIVPAPHTTSCAFGGKDLNTLYITTGRQGLSDEQKEQYPGSGGLFAVKPGVKGVPANFYLGSL